MPRAKGGFKTRQRRNKWLKLSKGFQSVSNNVYKKSRERVEYALASAFSGRKQKKRDMRQLWIIRINAAARINGTTYSVLMGKLAEKEIQLDRKVLADMAMNHPEQFAELVKQVSA